MQTARKLKALKSAKANLDAFDGMLENIVEGKDLLKFRKGEVLFSQGAEARDIYFIRTGKVQVTVTSSHKKEAILAMLGPHDFLGEGALVGDSLRTTTATSLEPSTAIRIEKGAMLQALHAQPEFSEKFLVCLLGRNLDQQEDLCDQLFNDSERRLARVLVKLSRFVQHEGLPNMKLPKFTHTMLAEIVGTTRSRISFFMNKFKKLGLVGYQRGGDITVMTETLSEAVLDD